MQLFLMVLLLTFVKVNVILPLHYSLKTNFGETWTGFLALKTPFLKFFGCLSFGRFVVWWLILYGDYVRVKRVGANPLYNLPRRLRKWSRCDCLPPSFAFNAPFQTSLFAMLTSLSCQHVANVALQNRFYRLNVIFLIPSSLVQELRIKKKH
ncbi:hypothetical protein B6D09_07830 [Gilliamella apis]|nr:hypothetical protein B6D09_07830 [Gilliamella apis]